MISADDRRGKKALPCGVSFKRKKWCGPPWDGRRDAKMIAHAKREPNVRCHWQCATTAVYDNYMPLICIEDRLYPRALSVVDQVSVVAFEKVFFLLQVA
jgi:hypothetical protein